MYMQYFWQVFISFLLSSKWRRQANATKSVHVTSFSSGRSLASKLCANWRFTALTASVSSVINFPANQIDFLTTGKLYCFLCTSYCEQFVTYWTNNDCWNKLITTHVQSHKFAVLIPHSKQILPATTSFQWRLSSALFQLFTILLQARFIFCTCSLRTTFFTLLKTTTMQTNS